MQTIGIRFWLSEAFLRVFASLLLGLFHLNVHGGGGWNAHLFKKHGGRGSR